MSLYPDQEAAAIQFKEWLENTELTTCGLWASAGYGKSHMVKHLIEETIANSTKKSTQIVITSLTHSAVSVLEEFTGMPVATLHSTIGWIPKIDKDTGEEYLSTTVMRRKERRLSHGQLVLVDEAGLLGHEELGLLVAECEEVGARVLFIGDHKQCFPVLKPHEKLCVPAYEYSECKIELTTPKRQSEGDMIYALAQAYRKAVDGGRQPKLSTMLNKDGSGKGVRHVDDIEEWAYTAFRAANEKGYINSVKILAYTNARCIALNRKIRRKVLGLETTVPIIGEEMVANSVILTQLEEDILIKNNQRVIVSSVEETENFGMPGAYLTFVDVEESVFVASSPTALQARLKQLAKEAKGHKRAGKSSRASEKWRAFFSLKGGCADIRFTYAMTVNKCQGTTLKHVLIDMYDIDGCMNKEQKVRLAYTAVSRATDWVTIEGELSG